MKKTIIFCLLLAFSLTGFAQLQMMPQWNGILNDRPETIRTQLISSTEKGIQVNIQVPGFYATNVNTPRGEAFVISVPKTVSTANAGEPDVPMIGIPAIIGDRDRMSIRVVDAQYMDFEAMEVAPSKGDFSRQIDPATVPYTYGECYSKDAFFPASNIGLYDPYIIRDFRGQNMVIHPFAYNPVTKTLRVYYNMTVEMYKVDENGANAMTSRKSNFVKMDPDFKSVYQRHFINYEAASAKYTPVDEEGDLLIICYGNFMNAMSDFVNWKKTRGVNTTIVNVSTAGSTYSAIKTYIQNQYNANNNLTHVLLVGDVAQIPGYSYSGGGSSYSGLGDNAYGQIIGNDVYNDLFIGRFSASSTTQVTTQVNRVITYERELTTSATWCQNGLGISASAGDGGHYNEDDYEHIENLRTDLLSYGYNTVYQDYASVSGYPSSTTTTISNHVNSGVGIINYCNHGEETGWQSHYYMNSNVNALTNNNKLPFIFSVACLVGKYDYSSGDCFAETWMHATNGSYPTGAIGGMFSYISQPWIPPMWAQDEFVDILVESYSNNVKHTLGGAAINGLFSIFDNYSTSTAQAVGTYQAWVLYGDPTLMLRTKAPQAMTVSHNGSLTLGNNSYNVNVTNGNGALATITDANHNILGKATVSNGTANISITGSLTPNQELTLCVFGYNKVTYLGTISVVGGTQYAITCHQPEHGTISAPEQAYAGATVTLEATPETGYCLSSWTVKDASSNNSITVNSDNTFTMPNSNVTVTATFVQGMAITLASVMNGSISANPSSALEGTTINLTASPASGYVLNSWVVYKTGDVNATVAVTGNSFIMPNYDVTVSAIFSKPAGGDVSIGSGTGTTNGCDLPTDVYYKYCLSQQIYTSAELGDAGTITAISFYYNSSTQSGNRTLAIYMSHTSNSTITSWATVSSSQLVYSGSYNFKQGWNTITLSTPFAYNGTSNLLLTVDDNTGSYYNISEFIYFYTYSTGANRAIYYRNDTNNPNPTGSISYTATKSTYNAQMKITKEVSSTEEYLSVSPSTLSGFTYAVGQGPSTSQTITLVGCVAEEVTVTAPEHYEVSLSANGSYSNTVSIPVSSKGNRDVLFSDDFDSNGLNSWTLVDADGDGRNWQLIAPTTSFGSSIGDAHSGTYCASSFSWSNEAYDPDNYMISPEVSGATSIHYYVATNTGYPDHYGVFASTTGTSTSDFNLVFDETAPVAKGANGSRDLSPWTERTIELPTGTKYVAFRHYESSDMNYLFIDDVTINSSNGSGGGDDPTTPTGSEVDVVTANLFVRLKAGLDEGVYNNETLTIQSGTASATVALNGDVTSSYHYSYQESLYPNNMTVMAVIQIEGVEQRSEQLEIGAFCGEECRGAELAAYCPPVDRYIVPLIVYGNPDDQISFKLYDHALEAESELSTATMLTFNDDGYGSINNPVILNFTSEIPVTVTQTCELNAGWVWWSSFIELDGINGLELLQQQLGTSASIIKSDSESSTYSGNGWGGRLTTIYNEQCYLILLNNSITIEFTEMPANPTNHPIQLKNGWNWIGYPCAQPMSLEEAFSDFSPAEGDIIKKQNGSSIYSSEHGWGGDITTLQPGQGYLYLSLSNGEKTLIFHDSNQK